MSISQQASYPMTIRRIISVYWHMLPPFIYLRPFISVAFGSGTVTNIVIEESWLTINLEFCFNCAGIDWFTDKCAANHTPNVVTALTVCVSFFPFSPGPQSAAHLFLPLSSSVSPPATKKLASMPPILTCCIQNFKPKFFCHHCLYFSSVWHACSI